MQSPGNEQMTSLNKGLATYYLQPWFDPFHEVYLKTPGMTNFVS
jgi:hypothetical protein